MGVHRSPVRYEPVADADGEALVNRMRESALANPRSGDRRIAAPVRAEGRRVNGERVLRLWRAVGLKVPRRQRKCRRPGSAEAGTQRRRAARRDEVRSYDFAFDQTADGRPLKVLPVVDESTRECPAMPVGWSMAAADVVAARGGPADLRSDSGPESIAAANPSGKSSHVVTAWMGNTPRIALANYLQTKERGFEKATGVPPISGAEGGAGGAEVAHFAAESQVAQSLSEF